MIARPPHGAPIRRAPRTGHPAGREPGRLVTMLGIVLPLPLVFHAWFVDGVIAPLLD
jgi:hypothetical protein